MLSVRRFFVAMKIYLLIYQFFCDMMWISFIKREVDIVIAKPIHVLQNYPVRKTKAQKSKFREAAVSYFENIGYQVTVESGKLGVNNIVVGNPETARYLITAHYDTPVTMFVPNVITPCNFLPFILWQLFTVGLMLLPIIVTRVAADVWFPDSVWAAVIADVFWLFECILLFFGPANPNNANDNTSGVIGVMDMAYHMPKELQKYVCFVLFDLEEAGLIGSASYAKTHASAIKSQVVFNLDCVGDGDNLVFVPTKKFRKHKGLMSWLTNWNGIRINGRTIRTLSSGFMYYPSDQYNFPYGLGVSALKKHKFNWLYLDRIHTKQDTIFSYENISVLNECIMTLMQNDKHCL